MMKVKFDLLYKNGHEDTITVNIETREDEEGFEEMVRALEISFRTGENAHLTLGDGKAIGMHVRGSELCRVRTTILDEVMA